MKAEDLKQAEERIRQAGDLKNNTRLPEGYFDQLSDAVTSSVKSIPTAKESGFGVPENYFEKLPLMISDRIAEKERGKVIGFSSIKRYAPVAIAAMLIAGVFIYKGIQNEKTTIPESITAEDIQESGVLLDIDEEAIIDQLADQAVTDVTPTDSMQQYLIDNNIDISQIENHL